MKVYHDLLLCTYSAFSIELFLGIVEFKENENVLYDVPTFQPVEKKSYCDLLVASSFEWSVYRKLTIGVYKGLES